MPKCQAEVSRGGPTEADKSTAPSREDLRDYWGDLYGKGYMTFCRKLGKYVPLDTYMPPEDREPDATRIEGVITEKRCRACHAMLPLDSFSPSKTGRGGVKARCHECCAEAARQYAATPAGKAARARALAKYEAQMRAVRETDVARAHFEQGMLSRANNLHGGGSAGYQVDRVGGTT